MKTLRTLALLIGVLIPTYAVADATGDLAASCCPGPCCPDCDDCPFA